MRICKLVTGWLAVGFCLLSNVQCGGDNATGGVDISHAGLTMLSFSECKSNEPISTEIRLSSSRDCVEYTYDGVSKLQIRRTNAAFNCCPDSLTATVKIDGSTLSVAEIHWLTSPCRCNCLYDLSYEIDSIPSGTIKLQIIEPLLTTGESILERTIDLANEPGGSFCVERDSYPWATGN